MATTLPPSWTVTQSYEPVPRPGDPRPPNETYHRVTWVCRNGSGAFVCADGSEEACRQQALSIVETTGAANLV